MRWSQTFISTLKEVPQEAEIASHALMIRAGLIQKLSSGLYIYLPLCLKVFEKVCRIVREELGRAGAVEILMPALQPKEIWEESGRWDKMGDLMMKVTDREQRVFVLGPTHEEIVTHLVSRKITSYRELPVNFYQIQTKFRDEIRPRFGLMRCREFIMKDGYSFNLDEADLDKSYRAMYAAYGKIFSRCGLKAVPVLADTGVMGGNESHEFMVLASAGEDKIVICPHCGYASNVEQAERTACAPAGGEAQDAGAAEKVDTPEMRKVEELEKFFSLPASRFIKTLVYQTAKGPLVALVRGDLEVQESKLMRYLADPVLALADDALVEKVTGAPTGFAGPVGLKAGVRLIADTSVRGMNGAVTGANEKDRHWKNVAEGRDFHVSEFADIGRAVEGDLCVKCGKPMEIKNGVEVGQVFKLGTKYSQALKALFVDRDGKQKPIVMGCYGIGVSRTVAAVVEAHNDEKGIVWPVSVAPFEAAVLPLNTENPALMQEAEKIYARLREDGVDALLDDRNVRAGFKFKDAELIGFPVQVALGEKSFAEGNAEVVIRKTGEKKLVPVAQAAQIVREILKALAAEGR